jgi:zinc/manganese transport system substrate-binding protein
MARTWGRARTWGSKQGPGARSRVGGAGLAGVATLLATGGLLAGLVSTSALAPSPASATGAKVVAVGAENEYANVISQVGGPYVSVTAIMSNPNTDPHEFEASASVSVAVSEAQLIVQNGVGYDSFMNKIESATHRSGRQVIVVQDLLGLSSNIFNPHLWYDPRTMPAVASAIASDLSRLQPAHRAFFEANARRFDGSLRPWLSAIAGFKAAHPGTPVAVTEPVADYMLQAAGARVLTPPSLQSAIMNGTDPSPQDIATEEGLITGHKVKALLYNQQVTDSLTSTFLADAKKARVPVVGVYETMPVPGYDYQTWMLAEVTALQKAVVNGSSAARL